MSEAASGMGVLILIGLIFMMVMGILALFMPYFVYRIMKELQTVNVKLGSLIELGKSAELGKGKPIELTPDLEIRRK